MADYGDDNYRLIQIHIPMSMFKQIRKHQKSFHIKTYSIYGRMAIGMFHHVLNHLDSEEGADFINNLTKDAAVVKDE